MEIFTPARSKEITMTVSEHRIAQRDSLLERRSPDASSISGEWPQYEIPVRPAAEKMRILFTINSLEGGGAEWIFTLVNSILPHLDTAIVEVLLTNPALQASIEERSRRRATHFAVRATIGRYAAVINEQLALVARARG
jgi:hypothetical protein